MMSTYQRSPNIVVRDGKLVALTSDRQNGPKPWTRYPAIARVTPDTPAGYTTEHLTVDYIVKRKG